MLLCCFFELSWKSQKDSSWGSHFGCSDLYRETLWRFRACFLQQICRTSLNNLTEITWIDLKKSRASTPSRLLKNWSFFYSVILFWRRYFEVQQELFILIVTFFRPVEGWHLNPETICAFVWSSECYWRKNYRIPQLHHFGFIAIVLGIRSLKTKQFWLVALWKPVWVLMSSCHLDIFCTWRAIGRVLTSQNGRFAVSSGFQFSQTH